MADLNSVTIPNFLGGISQQSAALRLSTQAEISINADPSPVEGLRKRPPTRWRTSFAIPGDEAPGTQAVHLVDQGPGEKYLILASNKRVRAFDLVTNTAIPVSFEDAAAQSYLNCDNPAKHLRMITVGSYTFLANRQRVVDTVPAAPFIEDYQALIWIKQGAYGSDYSVVLDGTKVTFKTADRSRKEGETAYEDGTGSIASYTPTPPRFRPTELSQRFASSEYVAGELYTLLRDNPSLRGKFTFQKRGSMILVSFGKPFTIRTEDSQGDTVLRCFKDRVQVLSELPKACFEGFRLRVVGDSVAKFDDFYVRYEGSFTGGTWVEEPKPGSVTALAASTMPHAIVREANGTLRIKRLDWKERRAGDNTSNPLPSFVGRRIMDVFFFRNRLGFIAGDSVCMSVSGRYFDFFKASAQASLDTDPIDTSVSHSDATSLQHALVHNETLALYGVETQFQISNPDTLTQDTASFSPVTRHPCNPLVRPVGVGQYALFAARRGDFASIREYYLSKEALTNTAPEITSEVPRLIPGDIELISASPTENLVFVTSKKDPDTIFAYRYLWNGEERLQSAWQSWNMPGRGNIIGIKWIGSSAWIVTVRGTTIELEEMDCSPGLMDNGASFRVHLDRAISHLEAPIEFRSGGTSTQIEMPYALIGNEVVIAAAGNEEQEEMSLDGRFQGYIEGEIVPCTIVPGSTTIQIKNRLTKFWVGIPYTMTHTLTEFFLRKSQGNGESVVLGGRTQLRRLTVNLVRSGFCKVTCAITGRYLQEYRWVPRTLGDPLAPLDTPLISDGELQVPLQGQSSNVAITFVNDSYMPSILVSGEIEAVHYQKARRLG